MTAYPHPVPAHSSRLGARRRHLLVGCALGATLAVMGHAGRADAQAFQGTYNPQAGDITRTTGTNTETITVNSGNAAVINWDNAQTDFLPDGNVATFQGSSDFVVLNRITSATGTPIEFNGSVLSRVGTQAGGTVIFQNREGIIIGPTATFDVGSLVLSTLGINTFEDGYGNTDLTPGDYSFFDSDSSGDIVIQPGAQINALSEGSYVAMVAPRIVQGGTVNVNGSAAYIGAREATLRVNSGLFDIEVSVGSNQDVPIEHTGTTTGPASTGAADPHRIYMVTAPDCCSIDPAQMLLSGNIGFADAVSATVENGQIVLAAGFDVANGEIVDSTGKYGDTNIVITGGNFTSDVTGRAIGYARAESVGGPLSFSGDLTLDSYGSAQLIASGGDITVGGDVNLVSRGTLQIDFPYSTPPTNVTGGYAEISANNGHTILISGDARLDASATGAAGEDGYGAFAGYGDGGTVGLATYNGGAIVIEGDANLLASGTGGSGSGTPVSGASGYGGYAFVSAYDGGITIDGGLNIDVSGTGSTGSYSGGSGSGGSIDISSTGTTGGISVAGASTFNAIGTGGDSTDLDTGVESAGGDGNGGNVLIRAREGSISFGVSLSADLSGIGGAGQSGGDGFGNDLRVTATTDAEIRLGNTFTATSNGIGGEGLGFDGGAGQGGDIDLSYFDGETFGLPSFVGGGAAIISVAGTGGDGAENGGSGDGGTVTMLARRDGGELEFGNVTATATGTGGNGTSGAGGIGRGGNIVAGTTLATNQIPPDSAFGPQALAPQAQQALGDPARATFAALTFDSSGTGGSGATGGGDGRGGYANVTVPTGQVVLSGGSALSARGTGGNTTGGDAGDGQGGQARIIASGAALITGGPGTIVMDASGVGGDGPIGGTGNGGFVQVTTSGAELNLAGDVSLIANGTGGNGLSGAGGNGGGGSADISSNDDGVLSAGGAFLSADGTGGNGTGGGAGGAGNGGSSSIRVEAGTGSLTLGNAIARARGFGGAGGALGAGGNGVGGSVSVSIQEFGYGTVPADAVLQLAGLDASASGTGGLGGAGDGFQILPAGGAGNGGSVFVDAVNGNIRFVGAAPVVTLSADGTGGDAGGFAGDGTGGQVYFRQLTAGSLTSSGGSVTLTALGKGGSGGGGGAGQGGTVFAAADGGLVILAGDISLDASGRGGDGDAFAVGATGTGGLARLNAVNGSEFRFANASVTSNGYGGVSAIGGNGIAGNSVDPVAAIETGAFVVAQDSTIGGNSVTISAQGFGGDSIGVGDPLAGGGDGGDGIGGTADLVALNGAGSSVIQLNSASVNVSAFGGDGATSYSGGDATAGIVSAVISETLSGDMDIGSLTGTADAFGGDAGGAVDSLIGNGGNATGGFIQIGTTSGGGIGPVVGSATFGTIQASASAVGGNGTAAGSNGGNGTGGALLILARGGTLNTGVITFVANGTGGNAGTGGTGGTGTGGDTSVALTPRFLTDSAPTVTIAGLDFTANGQGGNADNTGIGGDGIGGSMLIGTQETGYGAVGGSASLGNLDLAASGTGGGGGNGGDGTGGSITLQAQGVAVTFGNATMAADGTGGGTFSPATSPGLGSGGTITLASLNAAGTLTGTQLQGTASGSGPSPVGNSAGRWQVSVSDGAISIGTVNLDANGTSEDDQTSRIDVQNGTFNAGNGTFAAVGQIQVSAVGDATVTGGDVLFRGSSFAVSHEARPGDAATIDVGSLNVQVGTDVTVNQDALVRAATQINFEPDGIAVIGGTLASQNIRIRSADLQITDTGFIGDATTQLVELEASVPSGNQAPSQVVLGGTEDGPGYSVTQDEFGRIRGETLRVSVPVASGGAPSRPADVVVRDLALSTPTGNGAGVNNFQISLGAGEGGGGGILEVQGGLSLANAGVEDGIALIAPGGTVRIINPTGSVRVLGANELPAGTLGIEAANIWSASQEIIDQLVANPDFEGRDEALLTNDGEVAERGYIEGGEILLRVGSTLFVQNSGTADQFAGITVVQNTLTVEPTGQGIQVYAFGRRINPDGTFLTNNDYFREVEFGYGSGYTDTSEFNQCVIATGRCPGDVVPTPPEIPSGSEIIEGPVDEAEEGVPPPNPDRQQFVDVSFASESLLEEPVTSGGDSGVWDGEDDDCTENEPCEPARNGGR